MDALEAGSSYGTTGPEIHDIKLRRVDEASDDRRVVEASIKCSEAQRIYAVCDSFGTEYKSGNGTFDSATFTIRPNARWARFEIIGPDGTKAWSNPFDLTTLDRE